jgi:hypothetical protein
MWLATASVLATAFAPIARTQASGDSEGKAPYKAGLVTLCSTDTFVRVAGLNESPLGVTIASTEKSSDGSSVNLLDGDISDELRALYPITIPANSKNVVTWDLPIPAHLQGRARSGDDRSRHGDWTSDRWHDENGLDYKGLGGSARPNGTTCQPAPATSTTSTTTSTTSTTTTTTTTTTIKPDPQPVQLRPASLYSSSNSQIAPRAADGDPGTEFVTQMITASPPTWAWLNADLGETVPLVRIDWMWSAAGAADQFRIDVSVDGIKWTTVATPGEAPVGAWNNLQLNQQVRIVRFAFRNPGHDPQLGHLAEVRFFAAADFKPTGHPQVLSAAEITSRAEITVSPPTAASLDGQRYKAKHSARSSNSPANSAPLTLDGKFGTAWQTAMAVPPRTGWTAYDLGTTVKLGEIRWRFSQIGFADRYQVQTSSDGVHWSTIAKRGNASAANKWVTMKATVETRWVRFLFSNPNNDANIGYLSEVRFYAAK